MRYGRSCAGLTIDEVAERLGVSRSTVQRLEQGEMTDPRYQMLRQLTRFYGMDMGAINLAMDCDAAGMASGAAADEAMWDLAYLRLSAEQRADVVAMAICAPSRPANPPVSLCPECREEVSEAVEDEVMGVMLGDEPEGGLVFRAPTEPQTQAEIMEDILADKAAELMEEGAPKPEPEEAWFKPWDND